ncbi:MAG TPA: hypothetical protein PKD84_05340 [Propionicimonas sp.]|nr:hypothetical protein [Propionicimonas sp.]
MLQVFEISQGTLANRPGAGLGLFQASLGPLLLGGHLCTRASEETIGGFLGLYPDVGGLDSGGFDGGSRLGFEFVGAGLGGGQVGTAPMFHSGDGHLGSGSKLREFLLDFFGALLLDRRHLRFGAFAKLRHLCFGALDEFGGHRGFLIELGLGFSKQSVGAGLCLGPQLGELGVKGAALAVELGLLRHTIGAQLGARLIDLVVEGSPIMRQLVGDMGTHRSQFRSQQLTLLGMLGLDLRAAFIELGVEIGHSLGDPLQDFDFDVPIALGQFVALAVCLGQDLLSLSAGPFHDFSRGALSGLVHQSGLLGGFFQHSEGVLAGIVEARANLNTDLLGLSLGLQHLPVGAFDKFPLPGQCDACGVRLGLCFIAQLISEELSLVEDLGRLLSNRTVPRSLTKQRIHCEH